MRLLRILLHFVGLFWLCWQGMQVVHEMGHVLGAFLTGGTVSTLDLHPLRISRTDVSPNPHPLVVIWMGPLWGVLAPLALWGVVRRVGSSWNRHFQFFAGFCLIANGAYRGSAVLEPVGDAADLLQHGAGAWQLLLFAAITVPAGLLLWDHSRGALGIGRQAASISTSRIVVVWGILLLLLVILAMSSK